MEKITSFFNDKHLFRSRDERMVAGVAGGAARYLNVDPALVRLGLVALAIISVGTAAVAYLAAMLIVPEEPVDADHTYPAGVSS